MIQLLACLLLGIWITIISFLTASMIILVSIFKIYESLIMIPPIILFLVLLYVFHKIYNSKIEDKETCNTLNLRENLDEGC